MNDSNMEIAKKLMSMKGNFEKAGMKASIKMKKVIHDVKTVNKEVYNKAIELGLNHLESTILANRLDTIVDIEKYMYPRYRDVMDFNLLKDIDVARDSIMQAMKNKEKISLVTDYDTD